MRSRPVEPIGLAARAVGRKRVGIVLSQGCAGRVLDPAPGGLRTRDTICVKILDDLLALSSSDQGQADCNQCPVAAKGREADGLPCKASCPQLPLRSAG